MKEVISWPSGCQERALVRQLSFHFPVLEEQKGKWESWNGKSLSWALTVLQKKLEDLDEPYQRKKQTVRPVMTSSVTVNVWPGTIQLLSRSWKKERTFGPSSVSFLKWGPNQCSLLFFHVVKREVLLAWSLIKRNWGPNFLSFIANARVNKSFALLLSPRSL